MIPAQPGWIVVCRPETGESEVRLPVEREMAARLRLWWRLIRRGGDDLHAV